MSFKVKLFEEVLCLVLILAFIWSFAAFAVKCSQVRDDVLRLHILANSDSEVDQTIKLQVRDRILKESETLLCGLSDKQAAEQRINECIPVLAAAANDELQKAGSICQAEVALEQTYFETREYENVTLPAGEYEALRVKIGEAKGKNWWCVLYPQMCVASASARDEIDEKLDNDEVDIVTGGDRYRVKFFVVEIFEKIKEIF